MAEVPPEPSQTHITSDSLEVDSSLDEQTRFLFYGNVRVKSPELAVTCERMEVISSSKDNTTSMTKRLGQILKIVAIGNVEIQETDRRARAGLAELYPREGKIVLKEYPMVENEEGTVTGYRITLYRHQRKAVVEGIRGEQRPTVILPSLKPLIELESQQPENAAPSEQG